MAKKSLCVTYFLWLFGGLFGLHHFYLRRDFHALVWWMFAGGYFGAGWVRDLWRIPEYVKDANEDESYMKNLALKMRTHEKPPSTTIRSMGQMVVANTFGLLAASAIPQELLPEKYFTFLAMCSVPLATSLGVYIVGNIGREEGPLKATLIGSYLTAPVYFFVDLPVFLTSFVSTFMFNNFSKKWRRSPRPRRSLSSRVFILACCGSLYLTLWGSWLYFNCTITYQDQEEVKCRDAAKHFFKSPMWQEFVSVMKIILEHVKDGGWKEVWKHIVDAFDPVGEVNALKVLGLNATATQQEITSQYRKLSRQYHPDKYKDANEKQLAQDKFIEVQQAYEILSQIKSQRLAQNTRSQQADNSSESAY